MSALATSTWAKTCVLLLSTTEGEDKPLKYPTLINTAGAVIVNKLDLAAAVECDVDLLETNIRRCGGRRRLQAFGQDGRGFGRG